MMAHAYQAAEEEEESKKELILLNLVFGVMRRVF
jgi:hypothetical protein